MGLKMETSVLDELVNRLRSGRYLQGKEKLATLADGIEKFCCLGVLCEMAVEAGVTERDKRMAHEWETDASGEEEFFEVVHTHYGRGHDATLPPEVAVWAGLLTEEECGALSVNEFNDGYGLGRFAPALGPGLPASNTLAGMNDDGVTFQQIADWLVENVERV